MSKRIPEDVVIRTAHLARLHIENMEESVDSLSNMVAKLDLLSNIDTTGIKPTYHANPFENVFREDVLADSYSRDDMLKNATHKAGCYVVPKTFEGE